MNRIIASILLILSVSAFAVDKKTVEDRMIQLDIQLAEMQTEYEWHRYTTKIATEKAEEKQAKLEEEFRERQVRRMYEMAKFELESSIYNARRRLAK